MKKLESNWESLIEGFECPEWFRDAKFGVWSHWGPQAVPGQGDWYARYMYMQGHEHYNHHCRTYGHPSKVGFKDIAESWKAEKFDAEALVDLYKSNGAKYIMGQAAHCDNFDLWDSKHHSWNATQVGPKKDILGAWRDAARNAGLKFGFSEHLTWTYCWFNVNKSCDKTGPYAGVPYDGADPKYSEFYHEAHGDMSSGYPLNPSKAFVANWKARLKDAIDQMEPDLFYTDGGIAFGEEGLDVMAHFYNSCLARSGGSDMGVYSYKDVIGRRPGIDINIGEYRPGAGIEDLERGMLGGIVEDPWQTDTSSGPWYYNARETYKTPEEIVHMLADIVSKNGNLLLNYTQKPDGSLEEETVWIVKSVGHWLSENGEAIYGTRPWKVFGEGDTMFEEGEFCETSDEAFTGSDFRFTRKGNVVYAIALGKADSEWKVKSVRDEGIKAVSILGYDDRIEWTQNPAGLSVRVPNDLKGAFAWSLRIELA